MDQYSAANQICCGSEDVLKGCEEKVVPLLRRSYGWSIDKSRSTAVLDTNSRHCSPAD